MEHCCLKEYGNRALYFLKGAVACPSSVSKVSICSSISPEYFSNTWYQDLLGGPSVCSNRLCRVVKKASGRQNALTSSDRQLIRALKSALLLVKHDPSRDLRKVLVAVDYNATAEGHKALNEAVMDLGRRISGSGDVIELHSVSAYPDSDQFVHAPDVAKKLGIERSRAHVRRGDADEVIPYFANDIDADLVIVGNVGRRGLSGIAIGNTSEKILAAIGSDVLILVREDKEAMTAAAA